MKKSTIVIIVVVVILVAIIAGLVSNYNGVVSLSEEVDNDKLMLCLLKTYKEIGIKSIVLNSGKGSLRIK